MATTRISVFGAGSTCDDSALMHAAELLGVALARRECEVVTGGYGGIMLAVSRGARNAGGTTVGYTLLGHFTDNLWLTRSTELEYYQRRELLMGSDGFVVVLPGGIGTWCELMDLIHHNQKPEGVFGNVPRRVAMLAPAHLSSTQRAPEESLLMALHELNVLAEPPGFDHPWLRVCQSPYEAAKWATGLDPTRYYDL